MTTPAAQPRTQNEDRVTAGIVIVLLSGLSLRDTEAHVIPLLGQLGIGEQAARDAVALIVPQIDPASRRPLVSAGPRIERLAPAGAADGLPSSPALRLIPAEAPTPAQNYIRTTEVPRHSRYLVASARRFQRNPEPQTVETERRYLAQHLNAVRYAREAAKRIDNAVARHGMTLGWWAHLDSKTTAECRAAHGANFSAARPPLIGYPGTLHGGTCRCHAGPAHQTALTVDEATAPLRQNAVIPFATELSEEYR